MLWLRNTRPDLERPFRVPLGGFRVGDVWIGWVPLGGIVLCLGMAAPVAIDVIGQALRGQVLPVLILAGYAGACTLVYFGYALKNSTLHRATISGRRARCDRSWRRATAGRASSVAGRACRCRADVRTTSPRHAARAA